MVDYLVVLIPTQISDIPSVNIGHDFLSLCMAMLLDNVLLHPIYQMVLERSLDELVEDVG